MAGSESTFVDTLSKFVGRIYSGDWVLNLATSVVLALLFYVATRLWAWGWPLLFRTFQATRKLGRAEKAIAPESPGVWLAPEIGYNPKRDNGRRQSQLNPIIVVANLKGGVGKTTTVANLIGHYAQKKGKRVLAIDLDFQGSLTVTTMPRSNYLQLLADQEGGSLFKAAHLINDKDADWLYFAKEPIDRFANAHLIPSHYSLAAMETRVMVQWLIGTRKDDVRFHLARLLQSEAIQQKFDLILIDAPPRLTTGCVQALCAATHVLIPTVLDEMSARAVSAFADQLRVHEKLWPRLKILGVIGTMTARTTVGADGQLVETPLADRENDAVNLIKDGLEAALVSAGPNLRLTSIFPPSCFTAEKAELGTAAGNRIVYDCNSNTPVIRQISESFDRLGDEIDRRINGSA